MKLKPFKERLIAKNLLDSMPFNVSSMTEANIQAELYHRLKLIGINSYLEYIIDNSRFDIVVLDEKRENILLIIECKRTEIKQKNSKTKQLEKYRQYHIPIMFVSCFNEIDKAVDIIEIVMKGKEWKFKNYADKKDGVIYLFTKFDPNGDEIPLVPRVIR